MIDLDEVRRAGLTEGQIMDMVCCTVKEGRLRTWRAVRRTRYVCMSDLGFETQLSDFLCIRRSNLTSVARSVLRLEEDGSDGVEKLF